MKYVVYVHKDNSGQIFYVGHGTEERANSLELSETTGKGTGRGRIYSSFVKSLNFSYVSEIIKSGLTKDQAIDCEIELYDKLIEQFTLTNTNRPSKQNKLDKDELLSRFEYDESSPSCLIWKVDRFNKYKVNIAKAGTPAGHLSSAGYFVVKFNGKTIKVHRIIAVMFDIDVNGKFVDHINKCRSDNRINNLRSVTASENNRNKSNAKNSSSGIQGVTYNSKYNRWRVSMSYDGKEVCTYFSCKKYGYELALQLAINFRNEKISELSNKVLEPVLIDLITEVNL